VVISLERGANLNMAQLMPLPLTVSCFSKIQIGFTFLVLAYPDSPGQRAVNLINSKNILVKSVSFYLERLHRYGDLNLLQLFWATLYLQHQ